jgi:leader peptidase (prepilin peptidase)/N-methyltransferase
VNPFVFYVVVAFILGLIFGSFLNVCIVRLPRRESVVHPRSRCPQCGTAIRWHDNLPVISWLLLRGHCRDCKQPISLRYPLVELAVGFWFAAVVLRCMVVSLTGLYVQLSAEWYASLILMGIGVAILGFLLIGLMVMDWQTQLLPNAFTLWGIFIGFMLVCIRAYFLAPNEAQVLLSPQHIELTSPGSVNDQGNVFLTGPEHLIFGRITAICGAALVLLIIRWLYKALRHREGMGLGDVKLLAMIAAFLGFWPAVLSLFLGVLSATAYAGLLLVLGRANRVTKLAFGSFLAIGGLIAAQFGDRIIEMYSALLR